MRKLLLYILILLAIGPSSAFAQDLMTDSAKVVPDLIETDSLDITSPDSSSFEDRYKQHLKKKMKWKSPISFYDSAMTRFAPQRLNLRSQIERSFYHDAGDFLKSDPSFLLLDHQFTPMRKTLPVFGLPLGRLNYLNRGKQLKPFEHMPEPDGLTDFNDFPTTLAENVYPLPGAVGMILGGEDAVATVAVTSVKMEETGSRSSFLTDVGGEGYSFSRGRYVSKFKNGRTIEMSLEYRDAIGLILNARDDSYNYDGKMVFPMGSKKSLKIEWQLYRRKGDLSIWTNRAFGAIKRERFDRNLETSFAFQNDSASSVVELGYRHLRQGSYTNFGYYTRFNRTGNTLFANRDWKAGGTMMQLQLSGSHLEYDQGYSKHTRTSADINYRLSSLSIESPWALNVGGRYTDDFDFMGSAAIVWSKSTDKLLVQYSFGYHEREPTLHELNKRYDESFLYGADLPFYSDAGNSELAKERQIVGSLWYELGTEENSISVSLTGGKILSAIKWHSSQTLTNGILTRLDWQPTNTDIDFSEVSSRAKIKLRDWLTIRGGGSFRIVEEEFELQSPYQPEYQFFGGGELHFYWRQRILHLYAYSEISFVGPYFGYTFEPLGQQAVMNTKISMRIKQFRFNFIFQNSMGIFYSSREFQENGGTFLYYNISWDFVN